MKRVICLLLALVIAVGALPVCVLAEEKEEPDIENTEVITQLYTETEDELSRGEILEISGNGMTEPEPDLTEEEPVTNYSVLEIPEILEEETSYNGENVFPEPDSMAYFNPAAVEIPEQKETVFLYNGEVITFRDVLGCSETDLEKFLISDGTDIVSEIISDGNEETVKTVADLMNECGSIFAVEASEPGDYYFVVMPSEGYVFTEPNEVYVIYEYSILISEDVVFYPEDYETEENETEYTENLETELVSPDAVDEINRESTEMTDTNPEDLQNTVNPGAEEYAVERSRERIPEFEEYPGESLIWFKNNSRPEICEYGNLFGLFETEEEAEETAQIYGIEFISFEYGVGVFQTEEDPSVVCQRGKENGWPILEINYVISWYDCTEEVYNEETELNSRILKKNFNNLAVDGEILDCRYYEIADDGILRIVFDPSIAEYLAPGKHELYVLYNKNTKSNKVTLIMPEMEDPEVTFQATAEISEIQSDRDRTAITVDTGIIEGLIKGNTYTLVYTIVDEDGEAVCEPESIENDFIKEDKDIDPETVEFLIENEKHSGKIVDVRVSLLRDDELLKDLIIPFAVPEMTDEPKFETEATVNGLHTAMALKNGDVTVTDRIGYRNLMPNQEYTVETEICIAEADDDPCQELMNGKYTFTPENPEGEEEIRLKIDGSELAGKTIAVYEKILADDKIIFEHHDLTDEKQKVHFTDIQSDLSDNDGNKYAIPDENTVLVATLFLTNLEKEIVYTVRGILTSEGSTIAETETEYQPDNQYGNVELRYETDFSVVAGKKVVSEVVVYLDGVPVATDEQESEKNRSVYFPFISTYADNGNGEKTVTASKNAFVVDRIEYAGLEENTEYRVISSLYDVSSGKEIYLENGTFTENRLFSGTGNGSMDVIIPFNAAAHAGKTLVVFEELYLGDNPVTSHKNLKDEAQQVKVPEMKAVYNLDIIGGEPLTGSEIILRDITGGGETIITTDDKGIGYSALIPGHQYSIRQKSVKEGYVLNSNTYYFTYPKSGEPARAIQTIYNYPVGTAVIKKTDIKTGKAVSGATVTVYKSGSAVATLKTDSRGQIYFDARKYIQEGSADFTYKETAAPQGYNLNSSTYKFSVDRQGKVSGTLNFKECPYGTVMITKTNETGSPLSGARISVYTSTGKMIGQATTNSEGHIYFSAPEAGNYYYIEDVAPQGYTRADQKFVFSVDQYGRVSGTTSFVNTVSSKGKGVQTGDNGEITFCFTIMSVAILALISNRKKHI